MDRVDSDIKKIVGLGFLRKLRGSEGRFEVRRILKSFRDAQWLARVRRSAWPTIASHSTSRSGHRRCSGA